MKKLLLACCLSAIAAGAHAFPPHGDRAPSSEQRLTYMQKSLQLSDAQVQKLKPILAASEQQRKTLEDKYKISERKEFRADMKKLHEATQTQVVAVLTPQQVQALEAQRGPHKGFRGDRRGDGPKPPSPQTAAE